MKSWHWDIVLAGMCAAWMIALLWVTAGSSGAVWQFISNSGTAAWAQAIVTVLAIWVSFRMSRQARADAVADQSNERKRSDSERATDRRQYEADRLAERRQMEKDRAEEIRERRIELRRKALELAGLTNLRLITILNIISESIQLNRAAIVMFKRAIDNDLRVLEQFDPTLLGFREMSQFLSFPGVMGGASDMFAEIYKIMTTADDYPELRIPVQSEMVKYCETAMARLKEFQELLGAESPEEVN